MSTVNFPSFIRTPVEVVPTRYLRIIRRPIHRIETAVILSVCMQCNYSFTHPLENRIILLKRTKNGPQPCRVRANRAETSSAPPLRSATCMQALPPLATLCGGTGRRERERTKHSITIRTARRTRLAPRARSNNTNGTVR